MAMNCRLWPLCATVSTTVAYPLQMVVCCFEQRIFSITNLINNSQMVPSIELPTRIRAVYYCVRERNSGIPWFFCIISRN